MVRLHMYASQNYQFSDKQTQYIVFPWSSKMKELPVKQKLTVWYILIHEYPRSCGSIVCLTKYLQLLYEGTKC